MTINFKDDKQLQNSILCHIIDTIAPNNDVTNDLMKQLADIDTFDDRINLAIKVCPVQSKYSDKFIKNVVHATYNRLKVVIDYDFKSIKKLESPIVLLRPKENTASVAIEENYGLDKCTNNLTIHFLEGNHISIIDNKDCANIINRVLLDKDGPEGKGTQNVVTSMVETQREVKA